MALYVWSTPAVSIKLRELVLWLTKTKPKHPWSTETNSLSLWVSSSHFEGSITHSQFAKVFQSDENTSLSSMGGDLFFPFKIQILT